MFAVRCSPRAAPLISAQSQPSSLPAACKPRHPRSPPRTVCPACDPRQQAVNFNSPLSWDTSRVTDMHLMFHVRCTPKYALVCALAPARCVHTPQSPPPPPTFRPVQPAPHVHCLRPSAGRGGLQPASELEYLPGHRHGRDVYRALPPRAPHPQHCSHAPSPLHARSVHTFLRAPRLAASRLPFRSPPRTVCPA